jgi:hypothetical protein
MFRREHGLDRSDYVEAINSLLASRSVVVNLPVEETGLKWLAAGFDLLMV